MDITPRTSAILALSQQNLKWEQVLAELVDNSLDAGASRVDIRLGPAKNVVIQDDGVGCKNIAAMFTIGDHSPHETTRLGRYGIGLKDASLFLRGITEIITIYRGQRTSVTVDWNNIRSENGRWIAPDPDVKDAAGDTGTCITFSRFAKSLPQQDVQVEKLGFLFAPALLAGKQIRIISKNKTKTCVPYQLPDLTDIVATSFEVQGRGVKLRVGIVPDGIKNPHAGFTRQHGHRTIDTTALGAKQYSVSRIAGIVELDKGWMLTKNKDDVTELQDELGEAIFAHCERLLLKADRQSQQAESAALNSAVSELLSEAIGQVTRKQRESRDQNPDEPDPGTIAPKDTGRKRTWASKTSDKDGPVARAAKNGLTLDWSDTLEGIIGKADLAANRVVLNSEIPVLQTLRRDNQTAAIATLAFAIFVEAANRDEVVRRRVLPGMEQHDFMETWSAVVAKMPTKLSGNDKRRAS